MVNEPRRKSTNRLISVDWVSLERKIPPTIFWIE